MTAPVVDKLVPNENGPTPFTQSFYIPYEWQGNAPAPTGEGVYLQDFPELFVYVRLNYFNMFKTVIHIYDKKKFLICKINCFTCESCVRESSSASHRQ